MHGETALPHSSFEVSITLNPKPEKDPKRRNPQASFLNERRCKNPSQYTCKHNAKNHVNITHCEHISVIPKDARMINIRKSTNITHHINKGGVKSHCNLIWYRKSCLQNSVINSWWNPWWKLACEDNLIEGSYDKPTANIVLNKERLKYFLLMSGTRQGCPL